MIWAPPVADAAVRVDPAGSGWFGSGRGGRPHLGLDICVEEGELVRAPCAGRFKRWGRPYADDEFFRLFEMVAPDGWEARLFYVGPLSDGSIPLNIGLGQAVGVSQDITSRYPGRRMQNHVHVELRTTDERMIQLGVKRYQRGSWWYADPAPMLRVTKVRRVT